MSKILRRHPLALAITAALAVSPLTALAQDSNNLSTDAQASNQPTINATGLSLGSFLLYPEIALTGMYDDNIYFTRTERKADTITVLSPA
ncbi:outer membrane beta-barrel protein, partial [Acidihalobacter prosperus]